MLAGALLAMHFAALIVVPLSGMPPILAAACLTVLALAGPTQWALIHEAIHGMLLPQRGANHVLGRVLADCFGAPFRALRFAHLRHHRYNRTPQGREEIYDPETCSRGAAFMQHYLRIGIGLYAGELALNFLCWLPPRLLRPHLRRLCPDFADGTPGMARFAERELLDHAALREMRVDAFLVLGLYAIAFALYAEHWPQLLAFLALRGFLASQFDHAPHHATPLDLRDYALNMRAPRWLGAWLLNFNLHRAHHLHPNLPWNGLPRVATFESGDIGFVRAVLRQWRGPIAVGKNSATVR
ncbi:fatty acid desaturase family protein [Rudaea cellulosilytica]|uniref:fatty acid desaturase family protein n=1 Tax=Rudaea cellulosilytica TaxID=540746 RepID=UPI000368E3A1|nr:fatty acid desaturase [Rudaea cellulosilytica]